MAIINEIAMIDAGCAALASAQTAFIILKGNGHMAITHDPDSLAIAKVTGHKQFVIINDAYQWAVEPSKIREIHMNRRIQPWPRAFKMP